MMLIGGMRVVESDLIQPVPRLQLSHDFNACSDEMKRHMNSWLLEKFGTYTPGYILFDNTLVIHPEYAAILRRQIDELTGEK